MVDLMHCLTNLLFFDILFLYCYSNFNWSIICCLFSGDMYLYFGASISLFCNSLGEFFETLVNLPAILLPIKSPVASDVFWIALFEAVFIATVVDFLAQSRGFCLKQKIKINILLYIFYFWGQWNISYLYDRIAFSRYFI